MYYKIIEDQSNIVIAIIKATNSIKIKELAALAVKEEWGYDKVELEGYITREFSTDITIAFDCITEDGDEEIRGIELTQTTLYS